MRENNKINNTCRLCLARVDETHFTSIFPQTYLNGVSLVMKIMVCVSLTIQEDDPLPKKICRDCEESVNAFYTFREACSRAYFMLIQNFGELRDAIDEPPKNDFKSILPLRSTRESNCRDINFVKCVKKENKKENESYNDNFDLERKIPQHHIMCLDIENSSMGLKKEFFLEKTMLARNAVTEDPGINLKPIQESKEEEISEMVEELPSTIEPKYLAAYNGGMDCYQVEEIHERTLCGKRITERVKYKCLRCENNFIDLESVTAHYADYCQPIDSQKVDWASAGSSGGDSSSNCLDTFESLDENFELETKEMTNLEYSNNNQIPANVDSTSSSDISELKKTGSIEENQQNHCIKKDLTPNFNSTSSYKLTAEAESSTPTSRKSYSSRIEKNLNNCTTKPQLMNLGSTRKRKNRWLGKIEHPCPDCDRIFSSSSLLKRHATVHTGERPHACEVCDRRFAQLGQLNFHRKFHNNPRYRCHICSKPFLRPSDIEKHMRTHTGEKPYDCKICLKSFAQLGALQQHSRIHSGEKPYSCEICGKKFSQKANKTKHVKIHKEGERPHTCYICGRSFSDLSEMELHRAGHGGGRPRKCDYCEDSFRKLSELNHHVRRFHTFERQHKCMFCPKEFYSIYNLKQHIMVHTGQKPHACSKCDLRFTQKGNLTKHFERKHSEFIEKKDHYILVDQKRFNNKDFLIIEDNANENDSDDHLIVEREETIESEADTSLKRDLTCL